MKTLTRTIIVLIALNLITAGFALAQALEAPVQSQPPSATNISRDQREMDRLMRSVTLSTGRRTAGTGNTVLVIPTQEIKAEEILTINEDINVMSRIFEDKLNQVRFTAPNMSWASTGNRWMADSFTMYLGRGINKTGCMYLQGYGALFLMNVDFPLSAGPDTKKQEEEKTETEDVDQVWEETRQQIYEPQEPGRGRSGAERQEVKYDAEKVENLKTSLIQALKHAANIRGLKPDESVILRITGLGQSIAVLSVRKEEKQTIITYESNGVRHAVSSIDYPDFLKSIAAPIAIVIRAKKSDIDAFVKGDLDFDKFREKVQILSYPLLGNNIAGAGTSVILPSTGEVF